MEKNKILGKNIDREYRENIDGKNIDSGKKKQVMENNIVKKKIVGQKYI